MHDDPTSAPTGAPPAPGGLIRIRPLRDRDDPQVRRVFRSTLALGRPLPFDHPTLAAYEDLCLGWYLTRGRGSAVVADEDGRVRGYLLGCLDQADHDRWTRRAALRWLAGLAPRAVTARLRGDIGTFVRLRVRDGAHAVATRAGLPHPAHAHLNLDAEVRDRGTGHRLAGAMDRMVEQAGMAGWSGEINVPAGGSLAALTRQGVTIHARMPNRTFSWLLGCPVERVTVARTLAARTVRL